MKKFDYRGLKCPIPVLKAFKEIKKNPLENNFEFLCDDETAPKDFEDLCSNTNLKFDKFIKKKTYYLISISKN